MLEAPWVGVAAKEAAKKDEHRKTAVELAPVGGVNSTSIPTLCPRQSNLLCHMSQSPLSAVCCWTTPVFIMFQILSKTCMFFLVSSISWYRLCPLSHLSPCRIYTVLYEILPHRYTLQIQRIVTIAKASGRNLIRKLYFLSLSFPVTKGKEYEGQLFQPVLPACLVPC